MNAADDEIRKLTADFVAAFNAGDVERMMRPYASRYVDVNLPLPEQTYEQRAEYYRSIVARDDMRIEVSPDEIIANDRHATVRGTILLFKLDGEHVPGPAHELRYMELWEKQPDGWKAIWGIDAEVQRVPR
ncbi:MAG: YybH family protein [Thermoanaerobaculia bacterium]